MSTKYVLWLQIEEHELDGEDSGCIAMVGEPHCAGAFDTQDEAEQHLENFLKYAGDHRAKLFEARSG